MNRRRSQRWPPSPCLRWRALLPSPACGRGVGGEGAFASSQVSKRFRPPTGGRATSLLLVQKRSSQEKTTPRLALAGLPARQAREAGPGFSSGLLPARKGVAVHGNARCAALSSPPHRRPGAPQEQARIVRARSDSNSGALRACGSPSPSPACRGGLGWGALASARWERAALPGAPMARRAGGGKSAGWPAGSRPVFRRYMDVPSKNPVTRPRTRRAGCPEGAPSGCPSLWLLSLGHARESNSGADRRSKPLCSRDQPALCVLKAIAHRVRSYDRGSARTPTYSTRMKAIP